MSAAALGREQRTESSESAHLDSFWSQTCGLGEAPKQEEVQSLATEGLRGPPTRLAEGKPNCSTAGFPREEQQGLPSTRRSALGTKHRAGEFVLSYARKEMMDKRQGRGTGMFISSICWPELGRLCGVASLPHGFSWKVTQPCLSLFSLLAFLLLLQYWGLGPEPHCYWANNLPMSYILASVFLFLFYGVIHNTKLVILTMKIVMQ